jgi:hypothetical protein
VRAAPVTALHVAEQPLLCHGGRGASAATSWPLHKTNLRSGERKRGDKKERRKKDTKVVAEKKERTAPAVNRLF